MTVVLVVGCEEYISVPLGRPMNEGSAIVVDDSRGVVASRNIVVLLLGIVFVELGDISELPS